MAHGKASDLPSRKQPWPHSSLCRGSTGQPVKSTGEQELWLETCYGCVSSVLKILTSNFYPGSFKLFQSKSYGNVLGCVL